ncbi:CinA family protein [Pedobacter sp. GR22-6]|uniref:CinA family protein n=1 Tax=Pedobacter sp. GR22-6 TaxID=3127957 RepID=UPI00307E8E2A
MKTEKELRVSIDRAAGVLLKHGLTIAFAESATAGRVAAEFSLACNAGKFLSGGIVCYDAKLKTALLDVPPAMIGKYTPESMQVTEAISRGLSKVIPADIHVGITGLPCPGGSESAEKPVGTMFLFAVKDGVQILAERRVFQGDHQHIVLETVRWTADLLVRELGSQS